MGLFALVLISLAAVAFAADWTTGYHMYNLNGWMNDPIPVYDQAAAVTGEDAFHLFFMCDPNSPVAPWSPGGSSAWCHAHSPDMMTSWTLESPALPPQAPGTGSVLPLQFVNSTLSLLPNGTGAALFTSGAGLAISTIKDTLMIDWSYVSKSAVIPPPPASANASMIGDVYVGLRSTASGGSVWFMIVGSSTGDGMKSGAPAALLYESMDLKNWQFISVLWVGPEAQGPRMECPMYFPSPDGTRHVLMWSSPNLGVSLWMTGTEVVNASGTFFVPDTSGPMDSGLSYASKAFQDDTGRWVAFSWLQEQRPLTNLTHPGIQSLPREVVFNTDGTLAFPPAGEVSLSRDTHYQYTGIAVEDGSYDVGVVNSGQYNMHLSVNVAGIGSANDSAFFEVELLRSPDGLESTSLSIQQYGSGSCLDSPMLPGQDRPGNDISGTPVSGDEANPDWCRQSCCTTSGCVAWVFVQSQPGIGVPYCWLKDAVGPTNPLSDATSGVISYGQALMTLNTTMSSLDPTAARNTYSVVINGEQPASDRVAALRKRMIDRLGSSCPTTQLNATDLTGGDYTNVVLTTVADCVSACCDDTNCEAWTFTSNQTETLMNCPVNGPCCWLKSISSQKPNPNPLTTSGIVSRWSFSWDVDIYVDHSVVEAFANNGAAVVTSRVYPTLDSATLARLNAVNVVADVTLDYYEMTSSSINQN